MPEEAVKRRRRGAILAAIKILEKRGYEVTEFRRSVYDLEAVKPRDICRIKIYLDNLPPAELKALRKLSKDTIFSGEAWIYSSRRGKGVFSIKFI